MPNAGKKPKLFEAQYSVGVDTCADLTPTEWLILSDRLIEGLGVDVPLIWMERVLLSPSSL